MSTENAAADFYLGRGPEARYLGTKGHRGAPEHIDIWRRFQSITEEPVTEKEFGAEVADLVNFLVWPWLDRADSMDTPWTYMFDKGSVYVYRFGVHMATIVCNYTRRARGGGREPRDVMIPNFTTISTAANR